jgi:polyketide synthase PksN
MDVRAAEIIMDENDPQTNRVYFSAVKLFQALLKKNKLQGKRITILTTQLHLVTGAEQIAPAQSLLLGLVNTLPQEYGAVCNNIDIDSQNDQPELPVMAAKEILHNTGKEDRMVAYRYGQRWLQEYQQNTAAISTAHTRIKKGGVYLITGGLGNLGFLIARHLLQQYNVTLLLTGRKSVSRNAGSNGSIKSAWIKKLEALQAISPDVHYYSMDISDGNALEELVDEAEKSWGVINGVIHAAGVFDPADFELLEDITPEKTMRLFSPKIKGIENIYRVFKKRSPDFVMAASSVAAVLAGLGFSSYSSANLYRIG